MSPFPSKSMELHPQYRTEYGILKLTYQKKRSWGITMGKFHDGFNPGYLELHFQSYLGGLSSSGYRPGTLPPLAPALQPRCAPAGRTSDKKGFWAPWENGDLKSDHHPTKWWDYIYVCIYIYIYVCMYVCMCIYIYIYTVHNGDIINNIPLGYQSRRAAGKPPN